MIQVGTTQAQGSFLFVKAYPCFPAQVFSTFVAGRFLGFQVVWCPFLRHKGVPTVLLTLPMVWHPATENTDSWSYAGGVWSVGKGLRIRIPSMRVPCHIFSVRGVEQSAAFAAVRIMVSQKLYSFLVFCQVFWMLVGAASSRERFGGVAWFCCGYD
jgi:hypothetical protein